MTTTKVIGGAKINGRWYVVYVSATDGTAIELTIRNRQGGLVNMRDTVPGQVLQELWLSVGTPSDLDLIQMKGPTGGIVYEFGGCIEAALGQSPDVVIKDINFPIAKGSAVEVTTSD